MRALLARQLLLNVSTIFIIIGQKSIPRQSFGRKIVYAPIVVTMRIGGKDPHLNEPLYHA